MIGRIRTALISVVTILILSVPALAEKRVALVIGNSNYKHVTKLVNPSNDAQDLTGALKRLDFQVIEGRDLDKQGMNRIIRKFSKAVRNADVALFFYAGHGVQVNGKNYLAPVNAQLNSEADLDFDMVSLSLILRQMERAKRTNLVFLDACRDNPLLADLARSMGATRSASLTRGLARVETGLGTFISFSTQPGNVALDGEGRNSPFTKALLQHIETPGVDIGSMMINVRKDVLKSSRGKQVPWENSSLTGQFYFKPAVKKPAATPAKLPVTANIAPAPIHRQTVDNSVIELTFWNSIKDSKNPAMLRDYLNRFPKGVFSVIAKLRLRTLSGQKQAALNPQTDNQSSIRRHSPARSVHECDRLAAHGGDPNRRAPGVGMNRINASKAIAACREALESEPLTARYSYQLGRAYLADKNVVDGLAYMQKAADRGYGAAMYSLGHVYVGDRYNRKDLSKALTYFRDASDKNITDAIRVMGWAHEFGRGVAKNLTTAQTFYQRAASKGSLTAMYRLGRFFRDGAVRRDYGEAANWFKKAADKNYTPAMVSLGRLYQSGQGVGQSYSLAHEWFLKAANKNNRDAPAYLGLLYDGGLGVPRDYAQAFRWFKKGADRGDLWSTNRIGWMYQNGRGIAQNNTQAVHYYRIAADKGQSTAIYNLGVMYENGLGVARNYAQAVTYYRRAADRGEANAMNNLGVMYEKGRSVPKSLKQAAQWYIKAAAGGDTNAMNNIGWFYETGRGVRKSSSQAATYFLKSLRAGNRHAKSTFSKYLGSLSFTTKVEVQKRLRDAGVYSGAADGRFGPGTRQALQAYTGSR